MEPERIAPSVYDQLRAQGMTRRGFLQFCAYMTSLLALPASAGSEIEKALRTKARPSVIWISIQECTGCSE